MTFYAHYDKATGTILSIGGHKLPDDFPDAMVAEIEDDFAMKFMSFEYEMSDWFISMIPGQDKPVITQNILDLVPHDSGDMIELPRGDVNTLGIRVAAILSDDLVEFSIPEKFKGKTLENQSESAATFTLTKRNDPTFVISTFEVNIEQLMVDGRIAFDCDLTLRDYSMFTNKVFFNYQFEVTAMPKSVTRKVAATRYNKLVVYRSGEITAGVSATYDVAKNEIIMEVVGKTKLTWPNTDNCFIFLIKPNDPSVIYHALPINVDTFWQDKRVALQLPKDIDQAFGVASFPLSSALVFNRQSDDNRNKTDN